MMYVELLFPGDQDWTSVTHLVRAESYTQENILMNDRHVSVIDTVACTLKYDRLILAKMMEVSGSEKILFRSFHADETPAFSGYVTSRVDHKKDEFLQDIKLSVRDLSYKLDVKVAADLQYPASIDDPGMNVYSLFQSLLIDAGYTAGDIDPGCISAPETVRMVSAREGKTTYRKLIDELLRCYGYVFSLNAAGQFFLYQWKQNPYTVNGSLSHEFSTVKPVTVKQSAAEEDGILLKWNQLETLADVCLFQGSLPVGSDGIPIGVTIAPGAYYPEDGDLIDTYQKYRTDWLDRDYMDKVSRVENEDIALISSDSQRLVYRADEGITLTEEYGPFQAQVLFHNPTTEPLTLYYFEIWGRALFRSSIKETRVPQDAVNPVEETGEFLFTAGEAEATAKALYRDHRYGNMSYGFTIYDHTYQMGDIVHISQVDPALDTDVLLLSEKWTDELPGYAYKAMGISAYGDLEAITTGYYASKNTQKGEKGEDAISLQIISLNGDIFRPALTDTTLEAHVYQNGQDITDQYLPSRFRWSRTSGDTQSDAVWNSAHYSTGGKSIQITDSDVEKRATFFCELI